MLRFGGSCLEGLMHICVCCCDYNMLFDVLLSTMYQHRTVGSYTVRKTTGARGLLEPVVGDELGVLLHL
jgi:hypothetical protein